MACNASNSCLANFDIPEYYAVAAIRASLSLISLIAILLAVALLILFKKYNFFTQRLILYLCIVAALGSFVGVINVVGPISYRSPSLHNYCVFLGFADQWTSWSLLLAETFITVYVVLHVLFNKDTSRFEIGYVLIIYFSPILWSWLPFINGAYGSSGAWCWIQDSRDCCAFHFGIAMQFVVWYIPLYLLMIILAILMTIVVVISYRRRSRSASVFDPSAADAQDRLVTEIRPLIAYPFIFIGFNLILLINRIYNIANPTAASLPLWFISALSYPLQGAIIALAFVLDPETRKKLSVNQIKAATRRFMEKDDDVIKEYPVESQETKYTSSIIKEY